MGIFNLCLTTVAVWNKIPDILQKTCFNKQKKERFDLFEFEYYCFEYNDNNHNIYVLRNYHKYIKEYNLQDFYNSNTKQY